jgi:hypothetical protein
VPRYLYNIIDYLYRQGDRCRSGLGHSAGRGDGLQLDPTNRRGNNGLPRSSSSRRRTSVRSFKRGGRRRRGASARQATGADIHAIEAPRLVINGDADVVRLEHALALSRVLPHARLSSCRVDMGRRSARSPGRRRTARSRAWWWPSSRSSSRGKGVSISLGLVRRITERAIFPVPTPSSDKETRQCA